MRRDGRPTAYIHIGPHKTGSSSIKHFVRANEDELDRQGLFFPRLIDPDGKRARNHEDLAKGREIRPNGALRPGAKVWPEIEAVADRGEKDILLSSEMFSKSLNDEAAFRAFTAFFERRGYGVTVIAYVRDQPGWLNSWYVQSQKRLSALQTFEAFEEAYARSGRVDPWRYLDLYMKHGRAKLEVISFERAIGAGLERDFIARCGVAADAPLVDAGLRNPNAGAKSVFAAQEIMRRAGPELKRLRGFGRIYNGFKKRCADLGWDATPYQALDERLSARIRARYAEGNERFARSLFGESWADLCPPREYQRSMFDPARASRGELKEIETVVADVAAQLRDCRAAEAGRRAAE